MPEDPTDHRQVNTGGAPYIEGNVYADGDFVRGDKIVYTHSDAEQLDAYLQRAVTALEARNLRLVHQPDPPTEPYKFLDAFEIQDHPIFFGREDASDQLFAKVTAHRLTILHAKSGAGKSSLLQAGLGPRLVRNGRLPVYTRAYEDPVTAVKRAIASPAQGPWPALLPKLTLHEFLGLAAKHLNTMQKLVIILDQFEAFFALGPTGEHRRPFIDDLANCIEDTSLPVRFVIALRKDYYSDLSTFQTRLPEIFHHEMTLESMTRTEVEAAITAPIGKLGRPVTYDPALLDTLLADLVHVEVELPHLQIICTQLYGSADGEGTILLAAYEMIDRAMGILGGYIRQVLRQFGEDERNLAQSILVALVTSNGLKRVVNLDALAVRVDAKNPEVLTALVRLIDNRLVSTCAIDGNTVYEIAHEYLAPEIQKWFDQETFAAKQANELLEREVANWQSHRIPIPEDRLNLLHKRLGSLSFQSQGTIPCLVYSVVQADHKLEDWIGWIGNAAEDTLLELLRDKRAEIRRISTKGLGILWNLESVKHLSDHDPLVRQKAAAELGQLGDTRARDPLINCLIDNEDDVRQVALDALGKLLDNQFIKHLVTCLANGKQYTPQKAEALLWELRDDRAVEPLTLLLSNPKCSVRAASVRLLGRLRATSALDMLIAQLLDDDSSVRVAVADALGQFDDIKVVRSLIACLGDDNRLVRITALASLGQFRNTAATDSIVNCLSDDDVSIRRSAAYALKSLRDVRAVEPLIDRLVDSDRLVRSMAMNALLHLHDERAVNPLIAYLSDHDVIDRCAAAAVLAEFGDKRAVSPLIACLSDKESSMRRTAAHALRKLGDEQAVDPLIICLSDEVSDVRCAAIRALAELGSKRAVEPLIVCLSDEISDVRYFAQMALQKLGNT